MLLPCPRDMRGRSYVARDLKLVTRDISCVTQRHKMSQNSGHCHMSVPRPRLSSYHQLI